MKTWITVLLTAVIVFSIYQILRSGHAPGNSAIEEKNAVLLLDQSKDSNEYVVSYAKLSKPGYVLIYSIDRSGRRSVVGRSELLAAGEHVNVRIAKIEGSGGSSSETGGATSIFASIVADDGDGVFDETRDSDVLFDGDGVSEASEYVFAESPEVSSAEELAQLLADQGYTVSDDAEDALNDALPELPITPTQATSTPPADSGTQVVGPYVVPPMPRGNMMEVLPVP